MRKGGALIAEGSTAALMAEYDLSERRDGGASGERCSRAARFCAAMFADLKSPIAYGYEGKDLPVYFNQDPVLNVGAGGGSADSAAARRGAARR